MKRHLEGFQPTNSSKLLILSKEICISFAFLEGGKSTSSIRFKAVQLYNLQIQSSEVTVCVKDVSLYITFSVESKELTGVNVPE